MLPLNKLHKFIITHKTNNRYGPLYKNKKMFINRTMKYNHLYDILINEENSTYFILYNNETIKIFMYAAQFNDKWKLLIKTSFKPNKTTFEKQICYPDETIDASVINLINVYIKYLNNVVSKLCKQHVSLVPNIIHLYIESYDA